MTRSQTKTAELSAKLRARNPLIIIRTREEHRVEPWIFEAAAKANYIPRTWDVAAGILNMDKTPFRARPDVRAQTRTIDAALDIIANSALDMSATAENPRRYCWILRDATLGCWPAGSTAHAPASQPLPDVPATAPSAARHYTYAFDRAAGGAARPRHHSRLAAPDRDEIAAILDRAIGNLPQELRDNAATNGSRDAAIDAALGLAGYEAENCYADSIVQLRKVDPLVVNTEKKRIIASSKVLEIMDYLDGGFESVGGLDALKSWVSLRKLAYSLKARVYGVPFPRGIVLVGVSGLWQDLHRESHCVGVGQAASSASTSAP